VSGLENPAGINKHVLAPAWGRGSRVRGSAVRRNT
jgi:hypothetical protein